MTMHTNTKAAKVNSAENLTIDLSAAEDGTRSLQSVVGDSVVDSKHTTTFGLFARTRIEWAMAFPSDHVTKL